MGEVMLDLDLVDEQDSKAPVGRVAKTGGQHGWDRGARAVVGARSETELATKGLLLVHCDNSASFCPSDGKPGKQDRVPPGNVQKRRSLRWGH